VLDVVLADLAAEHEALDAIVRSCPPADWHRATPAAGWTVADQVFHLAFGEELAAMAVSDPDRFAARVEELLGRIELLDDEMVATARLLGPEAVLEAWRARRTATLAALRTHDPTVRIPWIAGKMSPLSFASARLMETWAHGQDVVDAVGATREPTARLRHIAELGVRTRGFSYMVRGMPLPETDVRLELALNDGAVLTWGEDSAPDRVLGTVEDFCLVVTQRRHWHDTSLKVDGANAEQWLSIAQVFAGPATDTRPARHPR
jgi:uncharacterized protein (TIGR03084 family)